MLLLLLVACLDPDAPIATGDAEPFEFEVPKGATAGGLGPRLAEAGLVPGGLLPAEMQWKLFLRQRDASCLKAGTFEVHRQMSLNELVDTLCGPPLADDVPFTVVEGWRIREIDAALAAAGLIEAGAYAQLATSKTVDAPFTIESPTLEGYLYPETYMVSPGRFSSKAFIERQLHTFNDRFLSQNTEGLGDRSLHEVVVMASMLEREEPKPAERPLVAGILWKRIDNGWQLGVDATSRYTIEDWNDRRAFLKQLRDPADPYNTRIHKGLPPTAIGNPSDVSLSAAISPVPSEYWFYLHDAEQNLHPARDGDEHEANRRKYNVY
ncbi:MAG: UPF0755 protein [Myxococcota bacterium]